MLAHSLLFTCLQAVAKQPIAISMDVQKSFQVYSGGVYEPKGCGPTTNHAMTLVGDGPVAQAVTHWCTLIDYYLTAQQ